MNRLPLSTALLSVVVAVVLWYIAMRLEGGAPPLEEPPRTAVPDAFRQAGDDTPVLGGVAALACDDAEREMQAAVDDARHCNVDEDCTIFDYGYPIQCLTSVAKSDISGLRMQYRDYEDSCLHRVYYDCPSEPLEREAVCRDNRCEVELRTLDLLKNQTLQHIGVDPSEPQAGIRCGRSARP